MLQVIEFCVPDKVVHKSITDIFSSVRDYCQNLIASW